MEFTIYVNKNESHSVNKWANAVVTAIAIHLLCIAEIKIIVALNIKR